MSLRRMLCRGVRRRGGRCPSLWLPLLWPGWPGLTLPNIAYYRNRGKHRFSRVPLGLSPAKLYTKLARAVLAIIRLTDQPQQVRYKLRWSSIPCLGVLWMAVQVGMYLVLLRLDSQLVPIREVPKKV